MGEKIYQDIFDKLIDYLPEDWKNMIFFAGYTNGSYSMKFYFENGDKKYTDCFSMPGASKIALAKLFMDIDKELSDYRKELGEDKAWTIFTMQVDSDGYMKTEYEYDDHSDDMIAYERTWEKKYLA